MLRVGELSIKPEKGTHLVPARLSHAINILLMGGTSAIHQAVSISIAPLDTALPFICNIAIAVGKHALGHTFTGGDVGLRQSQWQKADEGSC